MAYEHGYKTHLSRMASAILVGLLACVTAKADEQQIQALLNGNTLLITNRFGSSNIYFDPSGEFLHRGADPLIQKGRWRATGDGVCSTMNATPDGKTFPEFCMPLKEKKIGDEWTGHDPNNGKLVFKLVRGDVRHPQ